MLHLSLSCLLEMKGEAAVRPIAEEVLGFVATRGFEDPLGAHLARVEVLNEMQSAFEQSGRYPASRLDEVRPIDDELYKLSLLLSFVTTLHRFEILEQLRAFLAEPGHAPERLLSVGFGTGYELRWARELCPGWELEAFDASPESDAYARALLAHFGLPADGLRLETLPLERGELPEPYRGRFGKVVLCELLEHLERPDRALRSIAGALHPQGRAFLTMAVNLAQEDHVYLYRGADEAREQVRAAGLEIESEFLAPVSVFPFDEDERQELFKKGNYLCTARRPAGSV